MIVMDSVTETEDIMMGAKCRQSDEESWLLGKRQRRKMEGVNHAFVTPAESMEPKSGIWKFLFGSSHPFDVDCRNRHCAR